MNLQYISKDNVCHLVPRWLVEPKALASLLDDGLHEVYQDNPSLRPPRWDKRLAFWLEASVVPTDDGNFLRINCCEPEGFDDRARLGQLFLTVGSTTLVVPLNAVLKGSDRLESLHCVYCHTISTDVPLTYVGITKRRWFDRYAQHQSASERGSPFVFHSALRQHQDKPVQHRVLLCGVGFEAAMKYEEEFVDMGTLYPLGLNMIPGGFAGLRYLSKLGITAKTAESRDEHLERLAAMDHVAGVPNPLCAARWASDQDYVNRVVCGHSGRLTVEQVRQIRMLTAFGKSQPEVAQAVGVLTDRVRDVLAGRTYGRVA